MDPKRIALWIPSEQLFSQPSSHFTFAAELPATQTDQIWMTFSSIAASTCQYRRANNCGLWAKRIALWNPLFAWLQRAVRLASKSYHLGSKELNHNCARADIDKCLLLLMHFTFTAELSTSLHSRAANFTKSMKPSCPLHFHSKHLAISARKQLWSVAQADSSLDPKRIALRIPSE